MRTVVFFFAVALQHCPGIATSILVAGFGDEKECVEAMDEFVNFAALCDI